MYDKITTDALKRLEPLLEARDFRALSSFSFGYTGEYRDLIARQMRDAYEFGKKGAADELKASASATKRDSTTLINQLASTITDKQMSDLLFIVRAEVLKDLRKNQLSDDQGDEPTDETNFIQRALDSLSEAFATFFDSKVSLTGAVSVMQAMTRGRTDSFVANADRIYAYQWSAVLDTRTCNICFDLDGSVFTGDDNTWEPPIHIYCRCIKVAIMRDEVSPPDITGFPDNPGGVDDPSL
ncbi:phage minor head protein [Nakamurella sp. PAMC28650]|uniref:phage minor head protein n=1 Tax=Nakamurella sp. PAMC28650 TaxID=2762325 RepID=UPI00164E5A02|nr:phage minor head protein [Nakamurella sp. PAMC28650]QNK82588.1 minor capsid protein [Nakamurella sp. PAMC28650]